MSRFLKIYELYGIEWKWKVIVWNIEIISILYETKKSVLCVENKLQDGGQYAHGTNYEMQCKHDTNLQKQFEFAGREFKLLSNSLNYKVASNCLLAIHIRFA